MPSFSGLVDFGVAQDHAGFQDPMPAADSAFLSQDFNAM
jgi:hypothetical protein